MKTALYRAVILSSFAAVFSGCMGFVDYWVDSPPLHLNGKIERAGGVPKYAVVAVPPHEYYAREDAILALVDEESDRDCIGDCEKVHVPVDASGEFNIDLRGRRLIVGRPYFILPLGSPPAVMDSRSVYLRLENEDAIYWVQSIKNKAVLKEADLKTLRELSRPLVAAKKDEAIARRPEGFSKAIEKETKAAQKFMDSIKWSKSNKVSAVAAFRSGENPTIGLSVDFH